MITDYDIDFDDDQMEEENAASTSTIGKDGTIEDRYLNNVFLTSADAFDVRSFLRSKKFTALYCVRQKKSVNVKGVRYIKRGYIKCKGHKTYSCKCSIEFQLIQNYNPNEQITDNGEIPEYKPIWYITDSTSNNFHHYHNCRYAVMPWKTLVAKEFEISQKDVTNYKETVKLEATKLHASGKLNVDNLSAQLQMIISKERDMDLNADSIYHHYFLTENAITAIKDLVHEVQGSDGNIATMENVFQFLESSNNYVYCVDRRKTNEGFKQLGLCVFTKSGIQKYVRHHAVIEIDSTFKKVLVSLVVVMLQEL